MKKILRSSLMAGMLLTVANCAWSQIQQPFNGTPSELPGIIEAENFDLGGSTEAYYDITVANSGGKYRNESVDIEECIDGGYNIYKIETYEWLEYTVNITQTGGYSFEFRVASTNSAGTINLTLDGMSIGSVKVPNTGGMQIWRTIKLSYVGFGSQLNAGEHVLRASFSNTDTHYDMFNLDKIIVKKENQYQFTRLYIPGTIEAEHYDIGFGVNAYNDLTPGNAGGINRSVGRITLTENVDMETCSEGGINVGWIQAGEWLDYTVHVMQEDIYAIDLRVASNTSSGSLQLELDGSPITGIMTVPYTGGWQNWQTISTSGVPMSAGTHVLRVKMKGSEFNLNKIEFAKAAIAEGCTGIYQSDYSYTVSPAGINPTITFNPIQQGIGQNLVILYYGKGVGPYAGYYVTPGVPYQINATSGQSINFYFTYSHPAGGERNSSATPHTVTIGSCGSSARLSATSISKENSLYPNPMEGSDQLYLSDARKIVSVKIINAAGCIVLENQLWNTEAPLDLSSLMDGLYHVVINDGSEIVSHKIVR